MAGLVVAGSGLSLVDPTGANITIGVSAPSVTPIVGGVANSLLYDTGGTIGELLTAPGVSVGLGGMTALSGVYSLACSGVSATTTGTTEATGINLFVNVPANAMGPNGALEIQAFIDATTMTSAATITGRFTTGSGGGASGGVVFSSSIPTATQRLWMHSKVINANATNAQVAWPIGTTIGLTSNAIALLAIDTTTATVFRLNMHCPTGGGTACIRWMQATLTSNSGT